MADLAEGLIDWGLNKYAIGPALQTLVTSGTLTLAADKNIEQAADELINALIDQKAKQVAATDPGEPS